MRLTPDRLVDAYSDDSQGSHELAFVDAKRKVAAVFPLAAVLADGKPGAALDGGPEEFTLRFGVDRATGVPLAFEIPLRVAPGTFD